MEPVLGFPEADIGRGGGSIYGLAYSSQGEQSYEIEDNRTGTTDDREQDDGDLEPSLCGVSAHGLSVQHCPITGASLIEDGEESCEDERDSDSGIGHMDGLSKQVGGKLGEAL